MNITVELSKEEITMIAGSLDYFGDKIADCEGYSKGLKYWELCAKIRKLNELMDD